MTRETKVPKFVEEVSEWYDELEAGGKFVSFIAVAVVVAIIFFSIVWTPWVGGVTLIIAAVLTTIGCFIYIEENL